MKSRHKKAAVVDLENLESNKDKDNNNDISNGSTEFLYYKISSFLFNFSICAFLFIMFYFYQNDLNNFSIYSEVYLTSSKFHIKSLQIFNEMKEAIINPNFKTFNSSAADFSGKLIDDIYLLEQEMFNSTFTNTSSIPSSYYTKFDSIFYNDSCYLGDNFFQNNGVSCTDLFFNSTSYVNKISYKNITSI